MAKYEMTFTYTVEKTFEIEAKNSDEAWEIGMDMHCDVSLDDYDWVDDDVAICYVSGEEMEDE